jgi:hypothetical protein
MRSRAPVGRCIGIVVAGCVWLAALAALPTHVHAAFPGHNGKIVFANGSGSLETINPDGTGHQVIGATSPAYRHPVWSPDGSRIAFLHGAALVVSNADGSDEHLITSAPAIYKPTWSPDGTRIAYALAPCGQANCPLDIYVSTADGTSTTKLTQGNSVDPAWSPDGTRIAYKFFGTPNPGIYTIDPGGSSTQKIPNTGAQDYPENWSPDGTMLTITRVVGDAIQGWRINADGTGQTQLPPSGEGPVWSPDGSKLVFYKIDDPTPSVPGDEDTDLYTMNTDTTDQRKLLDVEFANGVDWQSIPINSYPRPKSAARFKASLVPAYAQCASPNRTHGPPLAYDSCNPPAKSSDEATLGTPDANGKPVKGMGLVRYQALGGNAQITFQATDVYDHSTLADYTGELRLRTALRITDKRNTPHPGGPGAATVSDTTLGATMPCTATADNTVGASCQLTTTANALAPGTLTSGARTIWELGQVQVDDGGADGDADTAGDNSLFMVQGLFVP